ncbi:MAG: FAD-dependent oxidoreductase [Acidimicrobiia bacterium]
MYDNLFEPLAIGGVTIGNRIVRTAHGTGLLGDELIAYHEARARGGVALSILEATGVHPGARTGLPLFADRILPFYEQLVERIAPHGMRIFQQLYHAGAGYPVVPRALHWSASDVPNPLIGVVPTPMTKAMIDEVVGSFAAAAQRCRRGGLDGVEIHAASGYLVEQFLSPATNHRDDEYGGTRENRVRFLREVLEAVRAEVGPDFPVGVRFSTEEYIPGGLGPADHAEIARMVEPLVDFVDAHIGSYWRFYKMLSPMDDPLGYEIPSSEVVTRAVQVPTIVSGRIMTLDHASHLVATGAGDMVSMVRALIADPDLVAKARDGKEDRVRPCIGSSMGCVGQLMSTGRLGCVVNVAAGREATTPFEVPEPAEVARDVLVVGGGPAGLEAARTAALRGHRVQLHELTRSLGGQVAVAARAPHRSDVGAITRWLADEVERLGVEVHLGSPVDPDLVAEVGPDDVIVATGSMPRRDGFQVSTPAWPIPGHDLPHVFTSWDVFGFGGRATIGRRAVVFDDTGTFEALSVADALLAAGASVTFVSRHEALGATVPYPPATVLATRERLTAGDFTHLGGRHLAAIGPDHVEVTTPFTDRRATIEADTVVVVGFNHPNRDLVDALGPTTARLHLVGDVNGGQGIQRAIREAATAARAI